MNKSELMKNFAAERSCPAMTEKMVQERPFPESEISANAAGAPSVLMGDDALPIWLQLFADALGCSIADLFRVQIGASEWAVTMEQMLSPLSDCEQKEVVEVVAKIVTLITARRPTDHSTQ